MITGERQTKHLIAGAVSGAVATGVTAPLELVKTILQGGAVQRNVGSLSILREQFRLGGTKACFRGLCPSLLAIIPHSGAYFWTYELFKKAVCRSENFQNLCGNRYVELGSSAASAMVAGAFANVITNPIWVVKTKMTSNALEYPNVHQTMRKIMSAEGYKGFFCGVGASVLGVSHVMVQFPVYESMKKSMGKKWDNLEYGPCGCNPHAESTQTILFASVTSKFAASVTTYPLEVIRTQMQKEGEIGMKAGIERCMKIFAKDKLGGFYRGFNASMMKSVPATAITLLMYEEIIKKIEASS